VHLKLRELVSSYTDDFTAKSIDEFVLNLKGYPALERRLSESNKIPDKQSLRLRQQVRDDEGGGQDDPGIMLRTTRASNEVHSQVMRGIAADMQERIRKEIGEWMMVSIGIAPNRYLAKIAAGIEKPNGIHEINAANFQEIYEKLALTDLTGISTRYARRLNRAGIFSIVDLYNASVSHAKAGFASVNGLYWYMRLRGWEIDDVVYARRSYGNSYALPKPLTGATELSPILSKLVSKMASRLRRAGLSARGVHVAVNYKDGKYWHKGVSFSEQLFDGRDIYKRAFRILAMSPHDESPASKLSVAAFGLSEHMIMQLGLFEDLPKKKSLVEAVDSVNDKWGEFTVVPARMVGTSDYVPDRIAFGGVKELQELYMR
jgi:DNA polymerase-4